MKTFLIIAWVLSQVTVFIASVYCFVQGVRFWKPHRPFGLICFIFALVGFMLTIEGLLKIL